MYCINLWGIHDPLFQLGNNSLLLFSLDTQETRSRPLVLQFSSCREGSVGVSLCCCFARDSVDHELLREVKRPLEIQPLRNVNFLA